MEKDCNRFLLARVKDPHRLCSLCRGKTCNIDNHCGDCHDWNDDRWNGVGEYHVKPALQRDRKKEKKVKAASSSFSFSRFSPLMPVPSFQLSTSYDSVIVTFVALSSPYVVIVPTNTYQRIKEHISPATMGTGY